MTRHQSRVLRALHVDGIRADTAEAGRYRERLPTFFQVSFYNDIM
jgi:hypothetical protein